MSVDVLLTAVRADTSLRFYLCPVIGDGSDDNTYRPKLTGLGEFSAMIPSNPDGTPKFSWTAVVVRATDWAALDADPTLEKLFDTSDLPDGINTFAEVKAYLQSKTVGDIPVLRRQALDTRLTAKGIDTSAVTLQTTWWQVLKGIYRHLHGADVAGDGLRI
jgi:hypothetical protein